MLFFICKDNLHTGDSQLQPILRSIYVINSSQKSIFESFVLLILCPFSYHVVPLGIGQDFTRVFIISRLAVEYDLLVFALEKQAIIYTVKPAHAVTSIKKSPVLSSHLY